MDPRAPIATRKPGRNDPCPCGSGRKYKACCAGLDESRGSGAGLARGQFDHALRLERQGRLEEALNAYRIAAGLGGLEAEAYSRAGHVLLALGRAGEAAQALRAAAGQAPQSPARRLDLARALLTEGRDAEAQAELRQLLALAPDEADAHWLLGRSLAEAGEFEQARAALSRAVALKPHQGAAYYDLVRCYKLGPADAPLIARMRAAAPRVAETDQLVRLHFAIGKALDDLGDVRAAVRHFSKANALRSAAAPFDPAAFEARVQAVISRFDRAFLARHAASADPARTPVLVVGLPRSGTTLVEQILSRHSRIAGAGESDFWPRCARAFEALRVESEIPTFQADVAREALANFRRIAPDATWVVDKTPQNFLWLGLFRLVFPNGAIIHCRRNALDVCASIHATYFAPRRDFPTRLEELPFYYRQYERLMDHWRETLPIERFVEVEYEALVGDPPAGARALLAAVGAPWEDDCLRPEANRRPIRTASRWQARQPINTGSVGRWRRYEPWLGPLRELDRA